MTNEIVWQSEKVAGSQDFAQLVYREDCDHWAIITTDCGRPQVVLLKEEDVGRLMHNIGAFLIDRAIRNGEIDIPDRSEKDCMWEE